jgi:uncharacterized tellurite resistance protein B-like protein
MDDNTRRKVCQLIAGIVITDEDLDEREEAFVERLLVKFGLDAGERDVIYPLIDGEEAAQTMRTLPPAIQREAFELLIGAAVADGKIVAEEREYLGAVALALGISEAELERRLSQALAPNKA